MTTTVPSTMIDRALATIASAATTDLSTTTSENVSVTGTTTITALGTIQAGALRYVNFAGALTLTHNATSLILPGAANITTAAGDCAEFISLGSGNWRCINYTKASGQAVVAPAAGVTSITAGNGLTGGTITSSGTIALDMYTGTSSTNTSYPIGTYLGCDSNYNVSPVVTTYPINSQKPLYRSNTSPQYSICLGSSSATALAGTWAIRGGVYDPCVGRWLYTLLMQRVA